jgi:ribosome-associated heat shock protein Hsp15
LEGSNSKVRIDKWLWAVRIYKSRSIAANACNEGKVKIKDLLVRPSRLIVEGEILQVRKNQVNYVYQVLGIISKRIPAEQVLLYMKDLTPDEEKIRSAKIISSAFYRPKGLGRPTKKERREIDKLREDTD